MASRTLDLFEDAGKVIVSFDPMMISSNYWSFAFLLSRIKFIMDLSIGCTSLHKI